MMYCNVELVDERKHVFNSRCIPCAISWAVKLSRKDCKRSRRLMKTNNIVNVISLVEEVLVDHLWSLGVIVGRTCVM